MTTEATAVTAAEDVSVKQQLAIDALLVGATDQQAADAAGVARSTVNGWRNHDEGFRKALAQARADLLRRTNARLVAAATVAVKALADVAADLNHSGRVAAAKAILDLSRKAQDEELVNRLDELEQAIRGETGREG